MSRCKHGVKVEGWFSETCLNCKMAEMSDEAIIEFYFKAALIFAHYHHIAGRLLLNAFFDEVNSCDYTNIGSPSKENIISSYDELWNYSEEHPRFNEFKDAIMERIKSYWKEQDKLIEVREEKWKY